MIHSPPKRPSPLFFSPPNGTSGRSTLLSLMCVIPACKPGANASARSRSLEQTALERLLVTHQNNQRPRALLTSFSPILHRNGLDEQPCCAITKDQESQPT